MDIAFFPFGTKRKWSPYTFWKGISHIYLLLFPNWPCWEQGHSRKHTSPSLRDRLNQAKKMLLIKNQMVPLIISSVLNRMNTLPVAYIGNHGSERWSPQSWYKFLEPSRGERRSRGGRIKKQDWFSEHHCMTSTLFHVYALYYVLWWYISTM